MSTGVDRWLLARLTGHSLRGTGWKRGVLWLASLALKVTAGAIHMLLVLAVVLFVIGFIRGRTGRTPA